MANLRWETAADWDNAASQSNVAHPENTVYGSTAPYSTDFAQDFPSWNWSYGDDAAYIDPEDRVQLVNGTEQAGWVNVDDTHASSGVVSIKTDYTWASGNESGQVWACAANDIWGAHGSSQSGGYHYVTVYDSGAGTWVTALRRRNSDGSLDTLAKGQSVSLSGTKTMEMEVDLDNAVITCYWEGSEDISHTLSSVETHDNTIGVRGRTGQNAGTHYTENVTASWSDGTGSLTTATKSFSEGKEPDLTYLTAEGSPTVTVRGSPSGTAEEHTVTLDGSHTHGIDWAEPHTNFNITLGVDGSSSVGSVGLFRDTSIIWGSEGDWDAAQSETDTIHDAGTLTIAENRDGFEDGSLSNDWTNHASFGVDSVVSHTGSYSAGLEVSSAADHQATWNPPLTQYGEQISEMEFYWWERSASYGGGIRLFNSNGNDEIGVASDNPEWVVDSSGIFGQVHNGTSYETWIRTTLTFDWANSAVTIDWEASDGTTYSDTYSLKHGVDIDEIQVWNQNGQSWTSGGDMYMWFDDLEVDNGATSGSLTTDVRRLIR